MLKPTQNPRDFQIHIVIIVLEKSIPFKSFDHEIDLTGLPLYHESISGGHEMCMVCMDLMGEMNMLHWCNLCWSYQEQE